MQSTINRHVLTFYATPVNLSFFYAPFAMELSVVDRSQSLPTTYAKIPSCHSRKGGEIGLWSE